MGGGKFQASARTPQCLWLKYGLDVKMVAVLKQEAFDWGSDKLPDALKYLISGSSSFEEIIIIKVLRSQCKLGSGLTLSDAAI